MYNYALIRTYIVLIRMTRTYTIDQFQIVTEVKPILETLQFHKKSVKLQQIRF